MGFTVVLQADSQLVIQQDTCDRIMEFKYSFADSRVRPLLIYLKLGWVEFHSIDDLFIHFSVMFGAEL